MTHVFVVYAVHEEEGYGCGEAWIQKSLWEDANDAHEECERLEEKTDLSHRVEKQRIHLKEG